MTTFEIVVVLRILTAGIFAVGAIWLARTGKDGWGWCIFASIVLGAVRLKELKDVSF